MSSNLIPNTKNRFFNQYSGSDSFLADLITILEILLVFTVISLAIILIIGVIVFDTKLKNIIRNKHPETYIKIGKPNFFSGKKWFRYVITGQFEELNDSKASWYGSRLKFMYKKALVYFVVGAFMVIFIKYIVSNIMVFFQ
ncbi:MAG: hypothetical protein HOD92_18115 [Deltaproteobacteria bacterium]|nr:hypothetical protein [Deltaproteobacteria bacterium]